jgi:phosphate transport system substrate-binding protein
LLDKEVDLIFSAPPSASQIADAEKKGLKYEITPFAKEAFVFFVNSKNPVENLTSEQIRGIYSGKITDWSQIDKRLNGKIKPFQRNQGSGSQTMLEKIMKDIPIMPPLREDRLGGMGGIINDVAAYRNFSEAIGFTFRYFSTEMFRNGEIKLLSIDGIVPTVENIRNGTYPFIADCCIITVKPRDENIRKIVDFMFSDAGKELIEKTGYVAVPRK